MFPVLLTYVRTYSNPRNGYRGIDPLGREVDSGLIFPLYICLEAYQGGYQTPYFGQECIIFQFSEICYHSHGQLQFQGP